MRTPEEKQAFKTWMRDTFLPVWRGQVDDWEAGVSWVADKTSWTPETIQKDILPWIYEWNKQKDLADKKRKFMAELPNIGVFFRKQKWKNPLPYSFQELRSTEEKPVQGGFTCVQCGEIVKYGCQAVNLCSRCYTLKVRPDFKNEVKKTLANLGVKQNGDWRESCLTALREKNLLPMLPVAIQKHVSDAKK